MGLAEPIRFLFHYAGVDFVDERLERESWPNMKSKTPFGQLPLLEVDGKKRINQSKAICRYLAKQFNLTGKDDWENLEIDATVDTINDILIKFVAYLFETVEEAKVEKFKALEEIIPFYITRLDEQVKKNGGYFVGGKMTWADIFFVGLLDTFIHLAKRDIIEKAENLKALRKKILDIPNIKEYVEKRPKKVVFEN